MMRTLSKWLIRAVWLLWILAMLVVGLKIGLDNTERVQVILLGWEAPSFSLGFIICLALLVGVVLGWLASTGPYLIARQRARRLEKQMAKTQKEISVLRTAPLKG